MGVVVAGIVEPGRRLGRTLGFPTANLAVPESLEAADGVYASRIEIDGCWHRAMSNLGCNPSVGATARRLETHVFDFDGSLYGRLVRVELLVRIREERHFDSVGALQQQIECDKNEILNLNL